MKVTKYLSAHVPGGVLRYGLLWVLALSVSACDSASTSSDHARHASTVHAIAQNLPIYVCPMHPAVIRHHPGHCPICGMALVLKQTDTHATHHQVVNLTPDVIQKLGVRTAKVVRGDLQQQIKTVGYVDYDHDLVNNVEVATAGWVENLSKRRIGLKVRKGELLLELYSPEFLAVQKEFLAAQKKDQSSVLRKYDARRQSVGPRDQLRYMGISDSLAYDIARSGKPRFRIPIYAPRYGEIVHLNIANHQFIPANYAMFTIADLSSVWVNADVYEQQMALVHRGLQARIKVNALPGQSFNAHVYYVNPELDPRTRTMKVRLLVPNPDWSLKPNMFAYVSIAGEPKQNVLIIPRAALIVTGQRQSVILARGNGQFEAVDVVAGMQSGDQVEIKSGLQAGDTVVVSGQFLIDSEANLRASFARFGEQK